MLDKKIELIANELAENMASIVGRTEKKYHTRCIQQIKDKCKEENIEHDIYVKHYWVVYIDYVLERK